MKELYGTFYGAYKGVSEEQIEKCGKEVNSTEIGKRPYAVKSGSEATLQWMSEEVGMMTNLKEQFGKEGSFPKAQNEIAGERRFFKNWDMKM